MADLKPINPWDWSEKFGYSQAIEVTGGTRTLYCAGQTSVDAEGNPVHPGNMEAQLAQAFDNLEAVLGAAGMTLANLVRLNYYVTDIQSYFESSGPAADRLAKAGSRPPGTLLGVAALFHPDIVVELEATAVG
jgi:enamine deaminase RidA (YjgF/YER057c/UK114 family)